MAGRACRSATSTGSRRRSATASGFAAYQQRGVAPSTLEGPLAVEREVADALAVLDALSWERAWLVGHSWGGHLLLHLAVAAPGAAARRAGRSSRSAARATAGSAAFEAEMLAAHPRGTTARAPRKPDAQAMRGEGSPGGGDRGPCGWRGRRTSPRPSTPCRSRDTEASVPSYAGVFASLQEALPRLAEAAGRTCRCRWGSSPAARSPMPRDRAAGATARAVPGAWLEVVPGAGHFPWFERPGCVRSALHRLAGTRTWQSGLES